MYTTATDFTSDSTTDGTADCITDFTSDSTTDFTSDSTTDCTTNCTTDSTTNCTTVRLLYAAAEYIPIPRTAILDRAVLQDRTALFSQ